MKRYLYSLIVTLMCTALFVSCDKDDDPSSSDIVGTWYGTSTYYNPVGGQKYQYLTIDLEANGTGSLEYEAPTIYSVAKFTYSVKNNIITCTGAYANSDGDVNSNFEMKLQIEGDRLIPSNKYTQFILTKDNSVITTGNGNELIDDSELIRGVWLHNSGNVVLVIDDDDFTEYTLMSPSSNIYSKKTDGTFYYNLLQKYVLIDGYKYDVLLLSETALQIKSSSGTTFSYTRGTTANIPTNGQNSTNYKEILENSRLGWVTNSGWEIINFYDSNKVSYIERSSETLGSWGHISLSARGTYSISGKTITCTYTDVSWQSGDSYAKDYFPGWSYGITNTKIYTIESINVEEMVLTCEGKRYRFYNYDMK